MSPRFKDFLKRWVICTLAVLVATYVVAGIHYQRWPDLLVATLLLGVLNVFVRPLLVLLSLPLVLVTLGLFTLVINAGLLLLVDKLLAPRFSVDSFGQAFLAALVISLVTFALNRLTAADNGDFQVRWSRGKPPPKPKPPRDDDGPVIDV